MDLTDLTPHGDLPQQVFCVECGGQLTGVNPRFCSRCGAPTVSATALTQLPFVEGDQFRNPRSDHEPETAPDDHDFDAAEDSQVGSPFVVPGDGQPRPSGASAAIGETVGAVHGEPDQPVFAAAIVTVEGDIGVEDGRTSPADAEPSAEPPSEGVQTTPEVIAAAPAVGDKAPLDPKMYPLWDGHQWVHKPSDNAVHREPITSREPGVAVPRTATSADAPHEVPVPPTTGGVDKRLLILGAGILAVLAVFGLARCTSGAGGSGVDMDFVVAGLGCPLVWNQGGDSLLKVQVRSDSGTLLGQGRLLAYQQASINCRYRAEFTAEESPDGWYIVDVGPGFGQVTYSSSDADGGTLHNHITVNR